MLKLLISTTAARCFTDAFEINLETDHKHEEQKPKADLKPSAPARDDEGKR